MTTDRLSPTQLEHLEVAFRHGGDDASVAMAKWLGVPSLITIESLEQQAVSEATGMLAGSGDVVCFCVMAISGSLTGHLILCCDDASGLSLTDLLLNRESGTAVEWGDVERSAALESHNIIGCAYLNSLARNLPQTNGQTLELIPSPPEFRRDFAESLLQAVFMDQAVSSDVVFVSRTTFELRGKPLNWTLLLVPDSPSMTSLRGMLSDESSGGGAKQQ